MYEVKRAGDKFNELDVGYFVKENELENYDEKTERVRYESGEKKGQLRMYEKGTFIYRLAGREREKSASYYTPEVLTKCLVKYALKELLKDKTADEILHLTVCEPAMGSAAFLNEAINQLAEAYLTKKQEELGETISYDKRFEELQKVKMFIADRNVYGWEACVYNCNKEKLDTMIQVQDGAEYLFHRTNYGQVLGKMLNNKVDTAYQMLISEEDFVIPGYVEEAIEWLNE